MKSFKWLIGLMLPYWGQIILALLLGALAITSQIGLMAASAYLLARAALHPLVLDLMVTIVGVRFFGITRAVFRYLERYVSHDVTFRMLSQIRAVFYEKIEPLAPVNLFPYQSGDLLGRIVTDVETVQNLFLKVIAPPVVAILVLVGYGIFLAGYDERFTFILAAGFLLGGLIIPWVIKKLGNGIAVEVRILKSSLYTLISESLSGIAELITYQQIHSSLSRLQDIDSKLVNQQRKIIWLSALSSALIGMVSNLGMLLIFALAIELVVKGTLNGVNLGMLALGSLSSFEVLFPLGSVPYHLEETHTAADRLFEIIDAEPVVREGVEAKENPKGFDLSFKEVSFKYGMNEPWTLKQLSFYVPEKGKVAIVGPSGAGKTSIVNLLLCFWEYDEGEIILGGHSLRDYAEDNVRSLFGVVTQRTHLFNATIKENLLMAKPEATDDELIVAAQRARLHDFILKLPYGYDSYIGEGGLKLSGGQRQRLAIARVLLKNAPFLILDEAMTGLDPVTEREVMDELYRLMEERTTILITHNFSGLENMDEILFLNKGEIVERGKHEQLLKNAGLYYHMWKIING